MKWIEIRGQSSNIQKLHLNSPFKVLLSYSLSAVIIYRIFPVFILCTFSMAVFISVITSIHTNEQRSRHFLLFFTLSGLAEPTVFPRQFLPPLVVNLPIKKAQKKGGWSYLLKSDQLLQAELISLGHKTDLPCNAHKGVCRCSHSNF